LHIIFPPISLSFVATSHSSCAAVIRQVLYIFNHFRFAYFFFTIYDSSDTALFCSDPIRTSDPVDNEFHNAEDGDDYSSSEIDFVNDMTALGDSSSELECKCMYIQFQA